MSSEEEEAEQGWLELSSAEQPAEVWLLTAGAAQCLILSHPGDSQTDSARRGLKGSGELPAAWAHQSLTSPPWALRRLQPVHTAQLMQGHSPPALQPAFARLLAQQLAAPSWCGHQICSEAGLCQKEPCQLVKEVILPLLHTGEAMSGCCTKAGLGADHLQWRPQSVPKFSPAPQPHSL